MKSTDFIDYYNKVYSEPYDSSRWDPIYKTIAGFLVDRSILDLGCGVGSLCRYEDRWKDYLGIDISIMALVKAKKCFPDKSFLKADIEDISIYHKCNIIVAIEVFEHVDFKKVIKNIEPTEIIFSLPNYYSHSHLWYPKSTEELHQNFDTLIDFDIIYTHEVGKDKKIWVCKGVVK